MNRIWNLLGIGAIDEVFPRRPPTHTHLIPSPPSLRGHRTGVIDGITPNPNTCRI